RAGATARSMLVSAAAESWQVPASACRAASGAVIHGPTGRSLSYGALVDRAAVLGVPRNVPLKDPKDFKLIGTPVKRLDTPDKVDGTAQFGIDVRLPGMKFAAVVARKDGDVAAAMAGAAQKVEAIYEQPFLAHATMEPVNCTVHVRPDACDIWVGTQVPTFTQTAAAKVTGLPKAKVRVNNHLLGGGFGRRLEVDFIIRAVQVAKQVTGPVL